MNIRDSYKTLEVDYGAPMEEVKQGYRDLVRVWHPDRFTEDPRLKKRAEEKLKEVNRAYGNLMAFFSHKMTLAPNSGREPLPRSWRKDFWGIGVVVARLGGNICQGVWHGVKRTELGRVYQGFFNLGNRVRAVDDRDVRAKRSSNKRGIHAETDGFQDGIDFRSVFDEVARERRAKREDPTSRG